MLVFKKILLIIPAKEYIMSFEIFLQYLALPNRCDNLAWFIRRPNE